MKCVTICADFFILPTFIFWTVSMVGLFGNIVNMLVFNHTEMRKSAVNSLFWWLSLSDLLELIILGFLRVISEDCPYLDIFMLFDLLSKKEDVIFSEMGRPLIFVYLLMAVHFCRVSLKITLAGAQCTAARCPLQKESADPWNLCSVKVRAILIYVLSFFVFSQFLLRIYSDEYAYGISNLILLSVATLKLAFFMALIVTSSMFIFNVPMTYFRRPRSLASAESVREEKSRRRMNNLIIVILVVFIISDMTRVIHSFGTLLFEVPYIMFAINDFSGINLPKLMRFSVERIPCLHWFFIVFNCTYSTFCYFIFFGSTMYKKTLKLMVNDWLNTIRPPARENPESVHKPYDTCVTL